MYLNLEQVAESFGVSARTVEDWIEAEGLPHVVDRGRRLFDRAQVARWAVARGLGVPAGFLTADNPVFATGCRLLPLLLAGGIWRDVAAAEVLPVIGRICAGLPGASPQIQELLRTRIGTSGGIAWPLVGGGVALPHPSTRVALGRDAGLLALILLREPLPTVQPPPDGVPVRTLWFFIAPSPRAHLDLLGRLGRALGREGLRTAVRDLAADPVILQEVAAADVVPASEREAGS